MDVPTRQAYVMALVDPDERTPAAAYTNTARYVSRPFGPPLAALAQTVALGLPFVIGGAIKSRLRRDAVALVPPRAAPRASEGARMIVCLHGPRPRPDRVAARLRLARRSRPNPVGVKGRCWGATGEPCCVVGVAWWWVREWLDRRAGRQGVEPVTLAIGDVPVCPPGPAGQRRLSATSWR